MGASIQATFTGQMDVIVELDETSSPAGGDNSRRVLGAYNRTVSLNGNTTPALDTEPIDLSRELAVATEVVDLTSVPAARDKVEIPDLDMTGKKLVGYIIEADVGNNTNGLTIKPDATDGYDILGTGGQLTVMPGEQHTLSLSAVASQKDAVAAAKKNLAFVGAVGDKVNVMMLFAA